MPQSVLSRMLVSPRVIVVVLSFLVASCKPNHVPPPVVSSQEAAAAAFALYDTNKDGYLDAKELESCPGLKSCLKAVDVDKDGRISLAELEECLTAIQEPQVALAETPCKITLNGNPLVGATVVLEPEPFMTAYIKPAKGTTNELGKAFPQIENAPNPGCHIGFYRVRISKMDGGSEQIPARYNTQSQLGLGVGTRLTARGSSVYIFNLTSP